VPDATPRATVVTQYRMLTSDQALRAVLNQDFESASTVILEGTHRLGPVGGSAGGGSATYRERTPEDVEVRVHAPVGGILVVRNPYDTGWKATVDGKPTSLFVADYVMQGVTVPPGDHVVELSYRDRPIAYGLIVSRLAWAVLAASYLWVRRKGRRSLPDPVTTPSA
jgi:hypothetical protein